MMLILVVLLSMLLIWSRSSSPQCPSIHPIVRVYGTVYNRFVVADVDDDDDFYTTAAVGGGVVCLIPNTQNSPGNVIFVRTLFSFSASFHTCVSIEIKVDYVIVMWQLLCNILSEQLIFTIHNWTVIHNKSFLLLTVSVNFTNIFNSVF